MFNETQKAELIQAQEQVLEHYNLDYPRNDISFEIKLLKYVNENQSVFSPFATTFNKVANTGLPTSVVVSYCLKANDANTPIDAFIQAEVDKWKTQVNDMLDYFKGEKTAPQWTVDEVYDEIKFILQEKGQWLGVKNYAKFTELKRVAKSKNYLLPR